MTRHLPCDCGVDVHAHVIPHDFPAYLVIVIVGHLVVPLVLNVEMVYQPAYWVHALLWGPLILITTLLPLRPVKGLLIVLQYHHKAAEGRFTGGEAP